jgi:hypothetical protein
VLPLEAGVVDRRWILCGEDGEEVADPLLVGELAGERQVGVDCVVVAAAAALARDVAGGCELGDDIVRGAFCDPDAVADLAQADAGVVCDAEKHPGVVGEKRPCRCFVRGHLRLEYHF